MSTKGSTTILYGNLVMVQRVDYSARMVGRKSELNTAGQKLRQPINVLVSKAIDMAALVNYQDGAVVSKTVISKKTGTVTVFAFARGQGLSTHSSPFDALVQILDGEAKITIAGKSLKIGCGQMVILPANKPHALKALKPFKMMLVMVKS